MTATPLTFIANYSLCHRRRFLQMALAGSATLFTVSGAFAEALSLTPKQTEGPFYPDHLPLDTDNDLLVINNGITPAVGEITHLYGTVKDVKGNAVRNALVEIWQVDHNGIYIHSKSGGLTGPRRDNNFQGFGRFLTNQAGEYYFRTIKPVAYGQRTPHIHFAVYRGPGRVLTTQLYVKGEAMNLTDGVIRQSLGQNPRALDLLIADFQPMPGSKLGELTAKFDIIVGETPADPADDRVRNGPPR